MAHSIVRTFAGPGAIDLLTSARHLDETSAVEFLNVMRKGRWRDIEPFAKLADT